MEEYRDVYLTEAEEMLQTMEEELLRLEQESSEDAVQRLFRAAHTLKGSSAAMGYTRTNRLTHDMEHVLEKVRNKVWGVTVDLATLLLGCVDRIRRLHLEIGNDNQEASSIDDLLSSLHSFGKEEVSSLVQEPVVVKLEGEAAALARMRLLSGERLLRVCVRLHPQCEMREARVKIVEHRLTELPALLFADEAVTWERTNQDGEPMDAIWLIAANSEPQALTDEVRAWMDVEEARVDQCSIAEEHQAVQASMDETEEAHPKSRASGATIRVNVERLEALMNLAGELVIEQTRLAQVTKELQHSFSGNGLIHDLGGIGDRLNRLLGELQENVMKVRMLPIEQLFNRFPRMVRDLTRSLGKDVVLHMEGKETELDRTLIEELGDPLIHLIRNAVDHGIERPDERIAAGKPAEGRLKIGAYQEDNHILICLEDDGAGINSEKLLNKAVACGVMTREEAAGCSPREAVDLIFHPGLSTAAEVSDISGRGVGMDIVRSCIEKINGMIEVETTPGQGTIFRIRLPLTLAIGTGLLVSASTHTFIIPMGNVAEIVRLEPQEIRMVKGMPVIHIRDRLIPVVWIHEMFGLELPVHTGKHIPIVIIGRGDRRAAIAVEHLVGNQEIVIKPLSSYIGQVDGIAGATILGTGRVALILEVNELLKRTGR